MTKVTREGRLMDRMQQGQARSRWDLHPTTEIQVAIVKGPILESRAREQGRSVCEVGDSLEDQRIRGRGQFDVASESEV